MGFFPCYMDLQDRHVLVVGGGRTARRKAQQMLSFGALVTLVSPKVMPEIEQLSVEGLYAGKVKIFRRSFEDQDIKDKSVVIAATNDEQVNARIGHLCRDRNIPVNVVDVADLCTFYFPVILQRGPIICAISSSGTSPSTAQYVREILEHELPPFIGDVSERLGLLREEVKRKIPVQTWRRSFYRKAFAQLMDSANETEDEELRQMMEAENAGHVVKIGTRGSDLALAQTALVRERLVRLCPGLRTETVILKTTGDRVTDRSLSEIGGKGLFVREIEEALRNHDIDLAVHSGKDLPAETGPDFTTAAVLPRGPAEDLLILREEVLPETPVIGTASPRREEMIRRQIPNAKIRLLRGNVPTRLRKLLEGEYDAVLLAAAGLERLQIDLSPFHVRQMETDTFIPASCQGIIAGEALSDSPTAEILRTIADVSATKIFDSERRLMRLMRADCHDAAGVYVTKTGHADEYAVSAFFGNSMIRRALFTPESEETVLREMALQLTGES